nr:MAG TPA: hypothetical protein [Siphoviridae sp. ctngg6]
MSEDNNCSYSVVDNPKFYIKDEYGNLKEFGKFASADTDLITCGEGSNFFEEIKPLEFVPPEKMTNIIQIIKNDTAIFNCDIDNVDLSFIWGNKKSIQIAELKYHLSMEAKNGNLLSNVVLEGLNRGLISVDEALYFVSNNWKRLHGFPVTRYRGLGICNKMRKKVVKQEIICDIFNKKLGYLCQFMYNYQTIIYKPDYLNDAVSFNDFYNGVIKGFNKIW